MSSFHRMPELGATPCLVRSTDFAYGDSPVLRRLVAVTHAGYLRDPATLAYTKKSLPALEFGYSSPKLHIAGRVLDKTSAADIGGALRGAYQWVDLDGGGLPGLLVQEAGALFYKRDLGGGTLGPARPLPTRPSMASSGLEVMDLDGDGHKEMVFWERPMAGYFDRTEDGSWAPFQPFVSQPMIDGASPRAQLIDLNGDGHEDLRIVRHDSIVWFPLRAKGGFDKPITLPSPRDDKGRYTHDPVGNIVQIEDHAQSTIYYNNQIVEPVSRYEYDALYRLARADGREHAGQNADIQQDHLGFPLMNSPHPNDPQALRSYTELYEYDDVGSILAMIHQAGTGVTVRPSPS